jgi:predicted regulator of Ras-like GTPase activity (Roadblock/LC7/MglB family)
MAAGLSVEQGSALNAAMADLVMQADAMSAFLIDHSGNVLAQRCSQESRVIQTMAALSAGIFCATRELAVVVGEKVFQTISHQGETVGIHMHSIFNHFIVLVLFGKNTTEGLVKLYTRRACEDLAPLLRQVAGQNTVDAAPSADRIEMSGSKSLFTTSGQ